MADTKHEQQEWYSNQRLYEMMVELSKGLESTNKELGITQTMIRDYNGLRERLAAMELTLATCQATCATREATEAKVEGKTVNKWAVLAGIATVAMFFITLYLAWKG